jgi:hypothetical protein
VAAEHAVLGALVEGLEVRVIGAHDDLVERQRKSRNGDRLDEVGAVGPVRLQSLVRDVETHSLQLPTLPVERESERALFGEQLGEQ